MAEPLHVVLHGVTDPSRAQGMGQGPRWVAADVVCPAIQPMQPRRRSPATKTHAPMAMGQITHAYQGTSTSVGGSNPGG